VIVADGRVGGVSESRGIDRIAEDFHDVPSPCYHHDRVTLVGGVPDVSGLVQCDAVVPSRKGCATKTLSRHNVLAVNVVSHPVVLFSAPSQ